MGIKEQTMDVTKLRPAPWAAVPCPDRPPWCRIYDANGRFVLLAEAVELAEEIALAHNAEDVMMRRGWHAERADDGRWFVPWDATWPVDSFVWLKADLYFANPFTALVESDAWYKANVEQAET